MGELTLIVLAVVLAFLFVFIIIYLSTINSQLTSVEGLIRKFREGAEENKLMTRKEFDDAFQRKLDVSLKDIQAKLKKLSGET